MSNKTSSRRTKEQKMLARFGRTSDGYQDKIDRQVRIITRLQQALELASGGLHKVATADKDVRTARKTATDTMANMAEALKRGDDAA